MLNKLAGKFWKGETTLEEERMLDEALQKDVPAEYQALADYRNFMRSQKQENTLTESFDQEMLAMIENHKPEGLCHCG